LRPIARMSLNRLGITLRCRKPAMTSTQFGDPFLRESFQDPLKQTEPLPTLWGNPECFAALLLNTRRRVAAAIMACAHHVSSPSTFSMLDTQSPVAG
jgi:hypothetical protein